MSITVNVVGVTNITTSILNSDQVQVGVGTFVAQAVTGLLVAAGPNVTVTTTNGVFTIAGREPPVLSVNGKTGVVALTYTDVLAAPASHTHTAANITDFATEAAKYGPVSSVAGKTGTVTLTAAELGAASASHTHVAVNITDFATEAAKYGPVSSVNGRTGTVVISAVDVTAASATHGHSYVQSLNSQTGTLNILAGDNITVTTAAGSITIAGASGGTSGGSSLISSVNGQTGTVTLVASDVSAASAVHTHVAANITDFATEAAKYGPVSSVNSLTGVLNIVAGANVTVTTSAGSITIAGASGGASLVSSVNGRTGTVTLVASDVSAASASHTHVAANITDFATEAAKYGPVSSVNGRTGTVTLVASDVSAASASHTHVAANITDLPTEAAKYGPVSSVGGKTGTVTLIHTDVSAASAVHAIQHMAGGADLVLPVVDSTSVSSSVNNFVPPTGDIIRISNTQAATASITGLAGGSGGYVRLLVNTSTNAIRIVNESTSSDSTNRFTIAGGYDVDLTQNRSVPVWYDATSQRWRVFTGVSQGGGTASAGVASVNGKTGTVTLNSVDVSAASAAHSHVAANITDLTSVANVVSVNGQTGTLSIVAGSNITVTTSAGSITVAGASGGGGSESRSLLFLMR